MYTYIHTLARVTRPSPRPCICLLCQLAALFSDDLGCNSRSTSTASCLILTLQSRAISKPFNLSGGLETDWNFPSYMHTPRILIFVYNVRDVSNCDKRLLQLREEKKLFSCFSVSWTSILVKIRLGREKTSKFIQKKKIWDYDLIFCHLFVFVVAMSLFTQAICFVPPPPPFSRVITRPRQGHIYKVFLYEFINIH